MRGIFQNGGRFGIFLMFMSLLSYFLQPYNWLSWLPRHWAMLLVPSERSKPLPKSHSIISRKAWFPWFSYLFLSFYFHLSSLRVAISVLVEPLELVSSQFFSAWVEDVPEQGRKKKEDIFCLWISWLWQLASDKSWNRNTEMKRNGNEIEMK